MVKGVPHSPYPRERAPEPILREAELAERFGTVRGKKNLLSLPGFENQTVQPISSRNTDYALPTD